MEVQQEPAPAVGGAGELPPAPHGAASVMATLMTDNGEAQSEGDAEMEQQAAQLAQQAAPPSPGLLLRVLQQACRHAHQLALRLALHRDRHLPPWPARRWRRHAHQRGVAPGSAQAVRGPARPRASSEGHGTCQPRPWWQSARGPRVHWLRRTLDRKRSHPQRLMHRQDRR